MDALAGRREGWMLAGDALEIFLRYLDADRDRAGARYEEIRRRLLTFFRYNGCRHEEDLADDTLDRVMRRIGEVEVRHLMSFIRGVARHVVSEKQKRAKELSLHDVPEPVHRAANEEREQEMDRRARCLKVSRRVFRVSTQPIESLCWDGTRTRRVPGVPTFDG
jgi:hypothetical protein